MKVRADSQIKVKYAVRLLASGEVVEASEADKPVELSLGEGQWPVQVELSLLGLQAGESVVAAVPASDSHHTLNFGMIFCGLSNVPK